MVKAKRIIEEIKFGIYKVRFLTAFLGAGIVYLISYFILMMISLPPMEISIVIALFFFISEVVFFSKKEALLEVEEKYKEISEELRTTSDNLSKNNELIEKLQEDVKKKVKKHVDMGDFVDFKKIMSRTLIIFLMSFLIIFVASLNIKILNIGDIIESSEDFILDLTAKLKGQDVVVVNSGDSLRNRFGKLATLAGIGGGENEGGEIFGDSEIVTLGKEKISLEIRPTEYELSIDDYEDPELKNFENKFYEEDVFTEKTYALEEDIPLKKQEIVKRYFKELASS